MKKQNFEQSVKDFEKAQILQPTNNLSRLQVDKFNVDKRLHQAKIQLLKSKRLNYYNVLGSNEAASQAELK